MALKLDAENCIFSNYFQYNNIALKTFRHNILVIQKWFQMLFGEPKIILRPEKF